MKNTSFNFDYPPLPLHVIIHAKCMPDKDAIVGDDCVLSWSELALKMQCIAAGLIEADVQPGDRVVITLAHKPDFMCTVLAAMAAGAFAVPSAGYEEDLESVITNVAPKVIVVDPKHVDHLCKIFPDSDTRTLDTLIKAKPAAVYEPDEEHIALFIHTSGTTSGNRRGAMLSHRSLSGTAQYINHHMGVTSDIRELVIPPLQHGFGMGRCRALLHAGGTLVLQDGIFSPASALAIMEETSCNAFSSASSGIALLMDHYEEALGRLAKQIRWIEMGTLPLAMVQMERLLSLLHSTRVFMSYGMTEAIRCTFLELNRFTGKLDTVGQSTVGTTVKILDDSGNKAPAGEIGKILVQGINMASGYWNAPKAWQEKLVNGWIDSGDLGWLDDEGFLHFTGRDDDMINVGGLKLSPVEVEDALKPLLGKTPYAVARVPDPDGVRGFVPGLFVEGDTAPSVEEVRKFLRQRLAEYKIPQTIECIDKLPRTTTTQKVRRAALAQHAEEAFQKTQLSGIPDKLSPLFEMRHSYWPLLIGRRNHSYKMVSREVQEYKQHADGKLASDDFIGILHSVINCKTSPGPSSQDIAFRTFHDGLEHALLHRDLETTMDWVTSKFPLVSESVVLIDIDSVEPGLSAGLQLAAVANCSSLLLMHPRDEPIAALLGAVYRYNVTHMFVGNGFLRHALSAERYLDDSFKTHAPDYQFYSDNNPDLDLLVNFNRRFNVSLQPVSHGTGGWYLSSDTLTGGQTHKGDVWQQIVTLAGSFFDVDTSTLVENSDSDNTPGWSSLTFVQMIAAVEKNFGVRLRPRDIMSIVTLGDLAGLVEQRIN